MPLLHIHNADVERGLSGAPGVVACCYVASSLTSVPFFASPVRLGRHGVDAVLPLPPLSASEKAALRAMLPELQANVDKGVAFARR
jgi:malate/lactate dehydrogenase